MEPCSRTLGMEIPVSLSEFELLTSYKQSSYLTVLLVVIGICIPKIEHGSINSNKLLFRFYPTRWIEDQSVAERSVKIWLNLVKVIKYWEGLCKSKRPKNSTYETLVLHYKNPLMITKFHFSYVAGIFKSYLVSFQTDSLMVPFMSDEIEKVFRKLCRLVLKLEVVDEATTPYKLIKINVSD